MSKKTIIIEDVRGYKWQIPLFCPKCNSPILEEEITDIFAIVKCPVCKWTDSYSPDGEGA